MGATAFGAVVARWLLAAWPWVADAIAEPPRAKAPRATNVPAAVLICLSI